MSIPISPHSAPSPSAFGADFHRHGVRSFFSSMTASPAFQFYPGDFLTGTAMMTAAEVGAYIRLLCYQWHTPAGLPDDPAKLARLALCEVADVAAARAKFVRQPSGLLLNAKLEDVRARQKEYSQQQADRARNGWQTRRGNAGAMPGQCPRIIPASSGQCSPSPSPSPCSYSSSENTLGATKRAGTPASVKSSPADDAAWLTEQQASPAYTGIDLAREAAKCAAWCSANGKQPPSRRRLVNWFNRAERPSVLQPPAAPSRVGKNLQ